MRYESYEEIPLKLFFKIIQDEKKLHLLDPEADKKELKKFWEAAKERYQQTHLSGMAQTRITKQRELLKRALRLDYEETALKLILNNAQTGDDILRHTKYKTFEDLVKSIKKNQRLYKYKESEFKQWLEDNTKEEAEKKEFNIYECLSSIEHVTGLKLDYETVTCGEFDAKQKLSKQIVRNGKRQING